MANCPILNQIQYIQLSYYTLDSSKYINMYHCLYKTMILAIGGQHCNKIAPDQIPNSEIALSRHLQLESVSSSAEN